MSPAHAKVKKNIKEFERVFYKLIEKHPQTYIWASQDLLSKLNRRFNGWLNIASPKIMSYFLKAQKRYYIFRCYSGHYTKYIFIRREKNKWCKK